MKKFKSARTLFVLFLVLSSVGLSARADDAPKKGYLGIFCASLYDDALKAKTIADAHLKKGEFPCMISMVDLGSPAEEGGLMKPDVIAKMNGKTFANSGDFDFQVTKLVPGSTVTLTMGDGKAKTLKVKPRPGNFAQLPKNSKGRGEEARDSAGFTEREKKATNDALAKHDAESQAETAGVRSTIRVKAIDSEKCKEYHFNGKCQGVLLDFIQPKCRAHDQGFSTAVNLILEIDGHPATEAAFYSGIEKKGPHSLKVYWFDSDPESDAFKNGTKSFSFDLAKCK